MEPLLDGGGGLKLPILAALPPSCYSQLMHTQRQILVSYCMSLCYGHEIIYLNNTPSMMHHDLTVCRSKSKTLDSVPKSVADLPIWNYDGSSCYQVCRLCLGFLEFFICNMTVCLLP